MRSRCRRSRISWPRAFPSCRPRRSPWSTRPGGCCRRPTATATRRCATRCSSSRIGSKSPMRNRIQELLTPLVGPGRVRAQVVAQVDMATTEADARAVQPAEPGRAQRIDVRRSRQEWRRRRGRRARRAHEPAAAARRGVAARRDARGARRAVRSAAAPRPAPRLTMPAAPK